MNELKCMAMMPLVQNPGDWGIIFEDRSSCDCNDLVFMQAAAYRDIFGCKACRQSNYWKGDIVKISFGTRSIHRKVQISSTKNLTQEKLVLTYESIGELSFYDEKTQKLQRPLGKSVSVSRGSRWLYWYRHPNPASRISFLLGMISIVLSVLSIGLSLWQFRG